MAKPEDAEGWNYPGFRSCDRQKARGATPPQRSRWVSASEQTSISGASRDVEPHSNGVRKRKMTLKLHSRTPSLLQDSTSLPATAESGIIIRLVRSIVGTARTLPRAFPMRLISNTV